MDKEQAITEMLKGNKVCHKSWFDHEYVLYNRKEHIFQFESGHKAYISDIYAEGYEIFKELKEYALEFYCNVNNDGAHSVHRTRNQADYNATSRRVACVALSKTAKEGAGLEMELEYGECNKEA